MSRFSDRGIPILSLLEKSVALAHCLARGYWEDAAGHCCDLLELCRTRIHPTSERQAASLHEMIDRYGKHPTPIDMDPS